MNVFLIKSRYNGVPDGSYERYETLPCCFLRNVGSRTRIGGLRRWQP